jgi:hypothetical protein
MMSMRTAEMKANADTGIRALARAGFAALGVVYLLVAALAIQVAVGVGGRTTDPRGALQTLVTAPFGRFLLGAIAIGLIGYALWRFVVAIKAPEGESTPRRVASAFTGAAYASMALFAGHLATPRVPTAGGGGGGAEGRMDSTTGWLMAQPFGRWLVVLAGLAVIGWGCYQAYNAWRGKTSEPLDYGAMQPRERTWVERFGRAGLAAFAGVSLLIGGFLVVAGLAARPNEARGLGGALASLAAQPGGDLLLALLAIGLAGYGAYNLMVAKYRRFGRVTA